MAFKEVTIKKARVIPFRSIVPLFPRPFSMEKGWHGLLDHGKHAPLDERRFNLRVAAVIYLRALVRRPMNYARLRLAPAAHPYAIRKAAPPTLSAAYKPRQQLRLLHDPRSDAAAILILQL